MNSPIMKSFEQRQSNSLTRLRNFSWFIFLNSITANIFCAFSPTERTNSLFSYAPEFLTLYHTMKKVDLHRLKTYADENYNVVQMIAFLDYGKGKDTDSKHFLLFPH